MKIQFAGFALLLAMPGVMAAQMRMGASATSFGVSVRTATINQTTPSATLPGDGSLAQAQAANVSVGTADGVVASASSSGNGSNADGSSLANVTVNGSSLGDNVAPNTRVDLPGVGYVVLNEQIETPGGITVNMIHVVLQTSVLGVTRTSGEIVVGSASSSVN